MRLCGSNMDGLCVSFWNSVKTAGKAEVLIGEPEVKTRGNAKNLARHGGLRHPSKLVSIGARGRNDDFFSPLPSYLRPFVLKKASC
jgi:hypothetical protein